MPASWDYDLFVIGAGSGGVRAARLTALGGKRVAIAEEFRVGGTCVIRGCVPKKLMRYAAAQVDAIRDARGYGWSVDQPRHDFEALCEARNREWQQDPETHMSRSSGQENGLT